MISHPPTRRWLHNVLPFPPSPVYLSSSFFPPIVLASSPWTFNSNNLLVSLPRNLGPHCLRPAHCHGDMTTRET